MSAEPWGVWLVDAVLAIAVLEAVLLLAFNAFTGRGLPWRDLAPNLAAGLCLMAGVRTAVGEAPWPWLLLCLSGAGVAHGLDLWRRARHPSAPRPESSRRVHSR